MSKQDADTVEELREGFQKCSKGKPAISATELGALLRYFGQNPTPVEILEILKGQQTISQDQFVNLMASQMSENKSAEEILEAFSVFDKDGRGHISASDLRHVLTGLGDKLDEEQVEEMLKTACGSGEGHLNYESFVRSVLSSQEQYNM